MLTDRRSHADDGPSLVELLPEALRDGFCSVWSESLRGHPQHPPVEVAPRGGTLVVFDAAVVPHEVLPVVEGRRCYLGGFFSEERTVPRAWAFGRGGLGPPACGGENGYVIYHATCAHAHFASSPTPLLTAYSSAVLNSSSSSLAFASGGGGFRELGTARKESTISSRSAFEAL